MKINDIFRKISLILGRSMKNSIKPSITIGTISGRSMKMVKINQKQSPKLGILPKILGR